MVPCTTTPAVNACGRRVWPALAAAVLAFFVVASASAQAPAAPGKPAAPLSAEELDKLVGRIALYPDDLVAIILPASTNPLQLVQAERFLEKRKANPKTPVDDKLDDPIKSLLNYPEIVKMMSNDLDWTADLGEAVAANQGAVLAAIQTFRRKTYAIGNLKTDTKQVVIVEKEVIRIVPADPQVIYVPQYNPTTVILYGGYSNWAYYPSPYPVYYYPYPPGAALATGLVWGAAIGAAWSGGHYVTHYHGGSANINVNRNVNINTGNVNINTGNINTGNINTGNINRGNVNRANAPSTLPAGSTQWQPNRQANQLNARSGTVSGVGYKPVAATTPAGAGARAQSAGNGFDGNGAGGGAFGGYGSGHEAQMNSNRGAASRNSMSAGGGRQPARGGGHAGRR